jgi:hypothetical protein
MRRTRHIGFLFSLVAALLFMGCGSSQVSVDESYLSLSPVKELQMPSDVPQNLTVTLSNVADQSSSYKNYVELYINDKLVNPDWAVTNVQNTWKYELKLRPGYYRIKAKYFAFIGWGEEDYEILTHDLVPVSVDRKTVLNCRIAKKGNGEPVDKKMYFDVEHFMLSEKNKPLVQPMPSQSDNSREPRLRYQPQSPSMSPAPQSPMPEKRSPVRRPEPDDKKVILQINTIPENAQVIINDRFIGNSPMRTRVNPKWDQVIQITHEGYRAAIKVLDRTTFEGVDVYPVIIKLEPK